MFDIESLPCCGKVAENSDSVSNSVSLLLAIEQDKAWLEEVVFDRRPTSVNTPPTTWVGEAIVLYEATSRPARDKYMELQRRKDMKESICRRGSCGW